jgi:aminoglycoside phosphotransferase (APT) family kinase protein
VPVRLGSGFDSVVHETADGFVHRTAFSPELHETFVRQLRFLPWLAERLPVAIPIPESLTGNTLVYRKVPGEVLTPRLLATSGTRALAEDIAGFMAVLHSLPVKECVSAGVSEANLTEELLQAFERTLPMLSARDREAAEAWRSTFVASESGTLMIHGDFWYENILIEPRTERLSGVLDFDKASIGDLAWDIAAQMHSGRHFARMVFEAYPNKPAQLWERARQLFQLREFEGLNWALRRGDRLEFEDSLRKLRNSGVLPNA